MLAWLNAVCLTSLLWNENQEAILHINMTYGQLKTKVFFRFSIAVDIKSCVSVVLVKHLSIYVNWSLPLHPQQKIIIRKSTIMVHWLITQKNI